MKERQNKVEKIFFQLVPQKFPKFSNLRKFMSVKMLHFNRKTLCFTEILQYNVQIARKTVN